MPDDEFDELLEQHRHHQEEMHMGGPDPQEKLFTTDVVRVPDPTRLHVDETDRLREALRQVDRAVSLEDARRIADAALGGA